MKKLLLIFSLISLIACSNNILDKSFSKENMDQDFKELEKILPLKNHNTLTSYVILHIDNDDLNGMSYREIQAKAVEYQEAEKKKKGQELLNIARETLENEGLLEKE